MSCLPAGPCPSPLMIIGEAPGVEEERLGSPFMGASGMELNRMLGESSLNRNDAFVTYLCRVRPPGNDITAFIPKTKKEVTKDCVLLRDRMVKPAIAAGYELLLREIELCKPKVILALGNASMWALTGKEGVKHWRGSQLFTDADIPLIPTYASSTIMRQWSLRAVTINDMRRVARILTDGPVPEPKNEFIIRPTMDMVRATLGNLRALLNANPTLLSLDIETAGGHIVCLGIGWSRTEAICIPFTTNAGHLPYWAEWEEAEIVFLLYKLLTHQNARTIYQNGLFDCQYVFRHWHFLPRHHCDTMIAWHSCFSTLPKGLDFLASMLCTHYVQWKGIARLIDKQGVKKDD